ALPTELCARIAATGTAGRAWLSKGARVSPAAATAASRRDRASRECHVDLTSAAMRPQEIRALRPFCELRRVEAADRFHESAAAAKQRVGKLDHQAVRPGVGPDLEQPGED